MGKTIKINIPSLNRKQYLRDPAKLTLNPSFVSYESGYRMSVLSRVRLWSHKSICLHRNFHILASAHSLTTAYKGTISVFCKKEKTVQCLVLKLTSTLHGITLLDIVYLI